MRNFAKFAVMSFLAGLKLDRTVQKLADAKPLKCEEKSMVSFAGDVKRLVAVALGVKTEPRLKIGTRNLT